MENIIFDIDDVIVSETGFMKKYAPRFLKRRYGIEAKIVNPNGYNVAEVYGIKEMLSNELTEIEKDAHCREVNNKFWSANFVRYMCYPLKKGVRKTINSLKKKGYRIYFLSTRGKKTKEIEKGLDKFIRVKVVPFLTKIQLKINFIKYNQLKLVQSENEKVEFINYIRAKFVFDDQISVLEACPDFTIPVCMESNHNYAKNKSNKILDISTFENGSVITLIENNSNIKRKGANNINYFEKIYTETLYVLVRKIFKNLFIKKYHPLLRGIENIPNDKRAIIYVGNHRQDLDPLIVTLYVKRAIHWAALLRLFEAKENLFGRDDIVILRKLSALFIKLMGAIPIARPEDTNYKQINFDSLKKMENYIRSGSSIGFFPEGTKNRNPKEQNIVALKSDAIFSMAKHNNTWIQPFAIVWVPKELNISNKVVLVFSKAIEVTGLKAEDIRKQWWDTVDKEIFRINCLFEEIREIEKEALFNYEKEKKKKIIINSFKERPE